MPNSAASAVMPAMSGGSVAGGRDLEPLGGLRACAHELLKARGLGDEQELRLLGADGEGVRDLTGPVDERAGGGP